MTKSIKIAASNSSEEAKKQQMPYAPVKVTKNLSMSK